MVDAKWVGEYKKKLLLAVALVLEVVEGLDIGGRALVLNFAYTGWVQVPLVLATVAGARSIFRAFGGFRGLGVLVVVVQCACVGDIRVF